MRDSVILSLNFCAALKHKYQDDVLCENSFSFFQLSRATQFVQMGDIHHFITAQVNVILWLNSRNQSFHSMHRNKLSLQVSGENSISRTMTQFIKADYTLN
jgi:hypothetical protein